MWPGINIRENITSKILLLGDIETSLSAANTATGLLGYAFNLLTNYLLLPLLQCRPAS
jgi:hypothetical protein